MWRLCSTKLAVSAIFQFAKPKKHPFTCMLLLVVLSSKTSLAKVYNLPQNDSKLIGSMHTHVAQKGDYFQALAEQYDVGFMSLMAANKHLDPFLIKPNQLVHIPHQMILPFAERKGIVINLSEFRLYYFDQANQQVHVFPIGIGRQGLSTPKVISYIGDKRENPTWRPTEQMKARHFAEHGTHLPEVVQPGPDNPFGKYALRIGTSQYLIHGTNKRFGIGMRASSGCIRMYDDDIKWLFDNVEVKTQVRIVDQPIKMSYEPIGPRLIEIHQPLSVGEIEPELGSNNDIEQTVKGPNKLSNTEQLQPYISNAVKAFTESGELRKQYFMKLVEQADGLVHPLP